MKKFENPTVKIEKFDMVDVITASTCASDDPLTCANETPLG